MIASTSKRFRDYCLLNLSLVLVLAGYGLVTGCFPTDIDTGTVTPEHTPAEFTPDHVAITARTPDGAMQIPKSRDCAWAGLLESACSKCSAINWKIAKTGLLPSQNVTFLSRVRIQICRPADSSIKKTTVKLLGQYTIPGVITPLGTPIPIPQSMDAYIPVRFE